MRVPNALHGRSIVPELNRIRTALNRFEQEITTGKRVRVPSDDPAAAARASSRESRIATIKQFQSSTDLAETKLLAVDTILDSLERLTDVAATSAAAGQSGIATSSQFTVLSEKVEGLREELLRLANSRYNGSYLFAGRRSLTPAFVESGGVVSYQGDAVASTVRVGEQAIVETSIAGSDLFVGALDAFQVLSDLRDALAAGDQSAVAVEAGNLEQLAARFSQFRARAGLTFEELERHHGRLSSIGAGEEIALSRDVDANLAESLTGFTDKSVALEAAIGAGARLLHISLLDVLG